MSNSNTIKKEIQDYDNLVEELQRISKDMTKSLRPRLSEITGTENYGNSIKNYVINNGIPVASTDELYSICSYKKPKDYILKNNNCDDDIRLTAVVLAVVLSYEFYLSIGVPLTECLKTRKPEYIIFDTETCMAPEDFDYLFTGQSHNIGVSLRNIFEKLKQIKTIFIHASQSFGSQREQFKEMSDQDYIELNDLFDSVLDDDYELFNKTANKIANKIGMRDFVEGCEKIIKMTSLVQAYDFIGEEEKDSENEILDKYYSMNGISFESVAPQTPTFCRMMFNYNSLTIKMIDNLPHKAKEALESFWSELDISWLAEPFKKWVQEEFQIIKKSVEKGNKKSKTRGKVKIDHLNVPCSPKMIRTIATGFVEGNNSPYLPKHLISSKAGDNVAINQLIYLFNGETDTVSKPSYSLEWNKNYNLNGLKLLIYLLHFKGEFKDNDPLNALDDNIETSKDGISEVVKLKNTGRTPVFPIVQKAFGTGRKSIQNAPKPKGGNRDFLEQIVQFWWYCKNSDTVATK